MLDLSAYLDRIGLTGQPSLADVHLSHATSIPFENLDPHRGIPVSLNAEDLEHKLVAQRRGGYCFEQNLLLKSAFEAFGAEVEMMLARVRWGAPPGTIRPRGHLLLRVRTGEEVWHADVGFGAGTLLQPIPFGVGGPYQQNGWTFRIVEEGPQLVLQTLAEDDWSDVYGFLPDPVPFVDVATSNWFTATNPASRFVTGLLVSATSADGVRTTLTDWGSKLTLAEWSPSDRVVEEVARESIPTLLEERFGLHGFTLGPDGRVRLAGDGQDTSGAFGGATR